MSGSYVDINSKSKGNVTTVHSAITATATSDKIDCSGKNALLVEVDISGGANNWTISLTGALHKNDTYYALYQQNAAGTWTALSYQMNSSRTFVVFGMSEWVKVVATEDVNGSTVTIRVQPFVM
jgi:hypothetical protein